MAELNAYKPIRTKYNGILFRSRLEARWAVAFEEFQIDYVYEMEGFELKSGPYLPDFWLPQVNMWAEVKPKEFERPEISKCHLLAQHTGYPCLMLDGAYPQAINYWAALNRNEKDPKDIESWFSDFIIFHHKKYHIYEGRFYENSGLPLGKRAEFDQEMDPILKARNFSFWDPS